jgi:hypothetical protein
MIFDYNKSKEALLLNKDECLLVDYLRYAFEQKEYFKDQHSSITRYEYSKGGLAYNGIYTKSLYHKLFNFKKLGKKCTPKGHYNFLYGINNCNELVYTKIIPDDLPTAFQEIYSINKDGYIVSCCFQHSSLALDAEPLINQIEIQKFDESIYRKYLRFNFSDHIELLNLWQFYCEYYYYNNNEISEIFTVQHLGINSSKRFVDKTIIDNKTITSTNSISYEEFINFRQQQR